MADAPSLNLHQRLNEIRRTNEYIQRDKKIDGQYTVVSRDAVIEAIRPDLVKYGVLILPTVVPGTGKVADTLKLSGAKKNPVIRYEAEFDVAFVNVDDPKDREIVRVPAHAEDANDKAPGKATTYAEKTAILKAFSLRTGDNEEERIDAGTSTGKMEEKELADWKAKIDDITTDAERTKVWVDIIAACNKTGDEQAITQLRGYLSAVSRKKGLGRPKPKDNGSGAADVRH